MPRPDADTTKVPHKLLLADDSVTIQRVIELTFADEDIRVDAVSDGDQAIARLQSDPPDIVLADVGMPGKDGYEVAAFVKRSPRLSHIPVVLLTGAFEPIDQARADSVGCDGVLAKPFEPQLVIGRVRELLASRPRPAAPLDANLAPPPAPAAAPLVPIADPAAAAPRAKPEVAKLDSYFDRLDAAMMNRIAGGRPAPMPDSIDRFASEKTTDPVPDLPLSYASPTPRPETPAVTMTPPAPATAAPKPIAADDLMEEVTRRVLERLSDRTVRETVTRIVSEIAERLVREEIERIKASIK